MAKNTKSDCYIKLSGNSTSVTLDTLSLFNMDEENEASPIDIFVGRNRKLMIKLGELERQSILNPDEDAYIYNLFLLGFVSNVESYFRSVIRSSILIDPLCYKACLEQQLTYAAAVHHKVELLPEALLENCTFISLSNISKTISSYLNIPIPKQGTENLALIKEIEMFEQLCELRNCIVHRAGLLGSKNAIKLGIDHHKNYFEKPIVLNSVFLQEASTVCLNAVRSFNNFLFNALIKRLNKDTDNFTWDYRRDKSFFEKYFNVFHSESLAAEFSARGERVYEPKVAYDELRDALMSR
ncbi:hypothetical protein [Vibrio toranzoniae]|uniref:hypothetical protein n=1 Tax=Vibrio toranzoniae TaxID=1194427 RepID=UPI0013787F80|nr:hypothetical protein [Vibrio toranzoniae]NAZ70561.1 hypothetical protein [Vibrio toranzoniae]